MKFKKYVFQNGRGLEACNRVLKPNGSLWISGAYQSIYTCVPVVMLYKNRDGILSAIFVGIKPAQLRAYHVVCFNLV